MNGIGWGVLLSLLSAALGSAPASAEPPPLIPRKVIFASPSKTSPNISPDGRRLAYLAPNDKGVQNVWVQTLGKRDDVVVTRESSRPVKLYRWAEDGGHILYLQDSDGDEGHGFDGPENNLDFFGRVEEFLARYVGGRAEPWKKVPGSTAELR